MSFVVPNELSSVVELTASEISEGLSILIHTTIFQRYFVCVDPTENESSLFGIGYCSFPSPIIAQNVSRAVAAASEVLCTDREPVVRLIVDFQLVDPSKGVARTYEQWAIPVRLLAAVRPPALAADQLNRSIYEIVCRAQRLPWDIPSTDMRTAELDVAISVSPGPRRDSYPASTSAPFPSWQR